MPAPPLTKKPFESHGRNCATASIAVERIEPPSLCHCIQNTSAPTSIRELTRYPALPTRAPPCRKGNSSSQSWQLPWTVPDAPPTTIQRREGGGGAAGVVSCAKRRAGTRQANRTHIARRLIGAARS